MRVDLQIVMEKTMRLKPTTAWLNIMYEFNDAVTISDQELLHHIPADASSLALLSGNSD